MDSVVIDKRKYVLLKQDEYNKLIERAARKNVPARKLTLSAGKKLAYSLVEKWHTDK
jgi:hypothetical protein